MENHLKISAGTYLHMVHGYLNGKRVLLFSEAIPNNIVKDFEKISELFYIGYQMLEFAETRGNIKVKVMH